MESVYCRLSVCLSVWLAAVVPIFSHYIINGTIFDKHFFNIRCVTLANDQLNAQFFYFIIRLLQSSTRFEQRRAHHQEVKLY
jgi:hypothetical protein